MAKWVRGQSGNPKGRPLRGRSVAELARAIAVEHVTFEAGDETVVCSRLERLLRVLCTMAIDGDLRAMRCFLEYLEGRPVQIVAAKLEAGAAPVITEAEKAALMRMMEALIAEWRGELEVGALTLPSGRSG